MSGGCEKEEPSAPEVFQQLAEDFRHRLVETAFVKITYVDGSSEEYTMRRNAVDEESIA